MLPLPRRSTALVAAGGSLPAVLLSPGTSFLVRLLTALLAAGLLVRAAALGRARWVLISAVLVGVLSGLVGLLHVLVTGELSPPGGLADWVYVGYGPLAAAGLLQLPRDRQLGPWRSKALLDATVAVTALGLPLIGLLTDMAGANDRGPAARAVAISYLIGAVFVLAVLLAALPRVDPQVRPFLRGAGAGLALLTLGDVGYSIGMLHGWYTPTTWPAVSTQSGLLLVASAAAAVRGPQVARRTAAPVPTQLETAAAYLPLLPVTFYGVVLLARGQGLSPAQLPLAAVLGLSLALRQLLTNAEQQRGLDRLHVREREAQAAARSDPLTGLANRRALHDCLSALLAEQHPTPVALALLDLDDFKDINDTHGHDTGDALLREVGVRLQAAVPAGALVVRLGGDEFAVCVREEGWAERLGPALVGALDGPVVLGARRFRVTASIGVVLADAGISATPSIALSHADVAMYEAKSAKTGQASALVVLAGRDRDEAAARVRLRDEISRPDLAQFRVVYEPVVDLLGGSLAGAEALLRWQHPVLGAVGPAQFIPLAEQVGSIAELGEFVLRSAARDLAGWLRRAEERGEPLAAASVGVNLSPRQLAVPGLCDLVREVLEQNALAPHRLVLEITEQALLDDWAGAIEVVGELRALGVGVAVDDFGTGWSSLRYLRRFDTSTLKVDREFVQAVADEPRTRVLVSSVLEMARTLGLWTVAEGVETLDQVQVLRAEGCQYAQGYLFDRPLERDVFGELLVSRHTYPLAEHPAARTVALLRRADEPPALPVRAAEA